MSVSKKLAILISLIAITVPLGASTASFVGNTFYIGVEDQFPNSDYDYNDLIFTLTGNNSITLNASAGTTPQFHAPIVPNNSTPPFWDNTSIDTTLDPTHNPNYNFGECLYVNGNGCTPGGSAIAPQANYLADAAGGFVNFSFSAPVGTVITFNLLAHVNGSSGLDDHSIFVCSPDPAVTTCGSAINLSGGTYTVTSPGTFNLEFADGKHVYDSNTAATGLGTFTDPTVDHFALAMTPEPGTLAVVGTVLVGLGVLRRRRAKK
jgi:hypothetical protein